MSKLLSRITGFFRNRTFMGVDKSGNRYFTRTEEVDGMMKEKRWVVFRGEEDPTLVPVEWICWLNGQRKKAPTPEEMTELETRRERTKLNVALLKKEEEERKAKEGSIRKGMATGKVGVGGPDLKSFIRQFPAGSEGDKLVDASDSDSMDADGMRVSKEPEVEKAVPVPESTEPKGSGPSFRPGTWQPPT